MDPTHCIYCFEDGAKMPTTFWALWLLYYGVHFMSSHNYVLCNWRSGTEKTVSSLCWKGSKVVQAKWLCPAVTGTGTCVMTKASSSNGTIVSHAWLMQEFFSGHNTGRNKSLKVLHLRMFSGWLPSIRGNPLQTEALTCLRDF